ncbi:MAG: hypothetical protein EU518_01060 [Promethearchaeota archaeon]|nr:MAG: hypothetical protein EU518_01060 [Candidatus Lokiarchaeota archaeon]
MEDISSILGLFFSDENNLIYENIRFSTNISEEKKEKLKMLPFKFLGPIFLTAATEKDDNWRINFIEASLSLHQERNMNRNVIQSFFTLNSTYSSPDGITDLFTLIGSPYTEDIDMIDNKITKYIHPSIIQGKIIKESILGDDFSFKDFIRDELNRGINLIQHGLGSSRKMYWKEQQNYYCIGIIERILSKSNSNTYLYTFEKSNPIRKKILSCIPSYYVMIIIPNFYENLINETLRLFDKSNVYPNIREINLKSNTKEILYVEEFLKENGNKKSYGFILIPEINDSEYNRSLSYYKKQLRLLLDGNENIFKFLYKINPHFDITKWGANSEAELDLIEKELDS